jgi:hypothetical protein
MEPITGVFRTLSTAREAVDRVRILGVPRDRINLLTPGATFDKIDNAPTEQAEQPGMGTAMGAMLGGVAGVAAGPLGAAALTAVLPGVGSVVAIGLYASGVLGLGGALAGAAAGHAAEHASTEGLPKDELFLYEDALRQGRTVVIVLADDEDEQEAVRDILTVSGAETIDAAKQQWWLGLRDGEAERYRTGGGDFDRDEAIYRRGFETALHADARGKPFDEVLGYLKEHHPDVVEHPAFRKGFERGRDHAEQRITEPITTRR